MARIPIGSAGSPVMPSMNMNSFLTKETIAQGLLDVALLASNVAQLKYVMSLGPTGPNAHPYYYPMVVLIWLSIALQGSVGLCLILMGKNQVQDGGPGTKAEVLNNVITAQVFLITVINVLISSFNIEDTIQRSGKFDDWIRDGNNTEYIENCPCVDPLRTFHQSVSQNYKVHCH